MRKYPQKWEKYLEAVDKTMDKNPNPQMNKSGKQSNVPGKF